MAKRPSLMTAWSPEAWSSTWKPARPPSSQGKGRSWCESGGRLNRRNRRNRRDRRKREQNPVSSWPLVVSVWKRLPKSPKLPKNPNCVLFSPIWILWQSWHFWQLFLLVHHNVVLCLALRCGIHGGHANQVIFLGVE